jgi:hypothetical protein
MRRSLWTDELIECASLSASLAEETGPACVPGPLLFVRLTERPAVEVMDPLGSKREASHAEDPR